MQDELQDLYRRFGSFSEGAYILLKQAIVSLTLAPGTKLGVADLRARTGLGAGPLREALARLSGERLVVPASQRGFWVAPVSREELSQLARLRIMLESAAVVQAVTLGDLAWKQRLRRTLAAFAAETQRVGERGPLTESWDRSHREFHMTFMAGCHDTVLLDLAETVYDRFDRYRHLGVPQRGSLAAVKDDHADLVGCAEAGDAAQAAAITARHITDVATLLDGNIAWQHKPGISVADPFGDRTGAE